MRILVTGANGFIAREIIATLLQSQHQVVAAVRGDAVLFAEMPGVEVMQIDFLQKMAESDWLQRLCNIDVVINCVGVFQTRKNKDMWQVHYHAPKQMFHACLKANVKKIIHVSALGIDQVDTPYAKSKLAIDNYLTELAIDSVIIRPSFVYGKDCYGGSALFRGLAGMPFFIFLPGKGEQLLQPIHIHDLANIVKESILFTGKHVIVAVGPEKLTLKFVINKLRRWLGFSKAINITVPFCILKITAKIGDIFRNSPISTTGVKMLEVDNVASTEQLQQLEKTISFKPKDFIQGLSGMVSGVQDRWHARLYFVRPLLRLSIAFIWIFSGIISMLTAQTHGYPLLEQLGVSKLWQPWLLYASSLLDLCLGLATLFSIYLRQVASIQIVLIVIYTIIISITMPSFWLHPFAPLAKNIPLLIATLVMIALRDSR